MGRDREQAKKDTDEFLENADRDNHTANDDLVQRRDSGQRHDIHGNPS